MYHSGEGSCVCGGPGVFMKSLYLPLNFAMSQKLLQKHTKKTTKTSKVSLLYHRLRKSNFYIKSMLYFEICVWNKILRFYPINLQSTDMEKHTITITNFTSNSRLRSIFVPHKEKTKRTKIRETMKLKIYHRNQGYIPG